MAFTKVTGDYIDQTTLTGVGGGGISWESTAKTSSFTASAGSGYFVDSGTAAITVTLPSSPAAGDEVSIIDYGANAALNNITITSSDNIDGTNNDQIINYNKGSVNLVYSGATKGWLAKSAANETDEALINNPNFYNVDFLIVAGGGGGGGSYYGGGGGAGGLRTSYGSISGGGSSSESALSLGTGVDYTISVGNGGTGVQSNTGNNGGDSYIQLNSSDLKRSLGGGGGDGGGIGGTTSSYGSDGGSGGGYSLYNNGTYGGGAGTSGQGYAGSSQAVNGYSSSGGGAGEAGHTADADAGDGIYVNILNATNATTANVGEVSGSNVYYAGGGGGSTSANSNVAAQGGLGGGGNGGRYISYNNNVAPTPGANNTGGGGAGGVHVGTATGSSGGSGVIILRYSSALTLTRGVGVVEATNSPFTEGSDKVSVFTGGTGTITFS